MFRFNEEKFEALLQIICQRFDDVDRLKAVKLLYYIDKFSLLSTGRPVLGDTYIKMDFGPVPSSSYDIIKGFPDSDDGICKFYQEASSNNSYPLIKSKNNPNMDVFSKREIESIDNVLKEYGHRSGRELSDMSHKDCTWTKSKMGSPIDYRLFFKDKPEESKHAYEAMLSELEDDRFFDDL
ncbi:MAG: SocA family protein [candidate division Zixibacteria bacterium]|nr:SocA family protein [candidate division Zixibacteria bacterium]